MRPCTTYRPTTQPDRTYPLLPPSLRRQYRLALGLSQQQVADVVAQLAGRQCDRSTVGRWEREKPGGREPEGRLRDAYGQVLDEMKERVG